MSPWVRRLAAGLLAVLGERWIRAQRRRHLPRARPLLPQERRRLDGYFSPDLLDAVRIRHVEQIPRPGFVPLLAGLGMPLDMDFHDAAGITFGDLVLIAGNGGEEPVDPPLLFHELVHVAQYRNLGIGGFARQYVRGWLENGRAYLAIPLEREAYGLEARFRAGESFPVEPASAVARSLGSGP